MAELYRHNVHDRLVVSIMISTTFLFDAPGRHLVVIVFVIMSLAILQKLVDLLLLLLFRPLSVADVSRLVEIDQPPLMEDVVLVRVEQTTDVSTTNIAVDEASIVKALEKSPDRKPVASVMFI